MALVILVVTRSYVVRGGKPYYSGRVEGFIRGYGERDERKRQAIVATSTETRLMTAEEFLALPEEGIHRELIAGRVIEEPRTYRNRWHAGTEAGYPNF